MPTKQRRSKSPPLRPPEMSLPGDVRLGPVLAIPAVLAEFGVKPQRAFARAGVDPRLFRAYDSRLQFDALARLFETCAVLTNCPHFGLLVGARFTLKDFGPLGYLMRNCASVGEALRSLLLHLHLHDKGGAPILVPLGPTSVIFGYSIYRHSAPAVADTQIYDASIAIGYRILRELCGRTWKAQRTQFSHGRPSVVTPYRQLFGPRVRFDAPTSGIVFAAAWLGKPISGADATLHGVLAKAMRDAEVDSPRTFAVQVRSVLHQMLLSGTASADAVARLFAVPERTLRRRLAKEGKTLQQLINETRYELAQQLLQNTHLRVSEIAAALQYADPNAFSRAFQIWADRSPSQWRSEQITHDGA
jgi:AraC-like DNA-binding protein